MLENVKQKDIAGYDGTRIHYQDVGEGKKVIVFANGLGGSFEAWYYVTKHLVEDHRLISWDYRGLFGSGTPDLGRVTIPDHVDDLTRILDKEGVEKALFLGWSMGTQVILEHAIRRPDRTLGLVLVCGAAGRPFDTALYTSTSRFTLPVVFQGMKKLHKVFGHAMNRLVAIPYGFEAITASKLFWRGGSEVIRGMVDDYVKLNFETYAQIMIELGRHDARPFLPEIKAPVFIFAATRDFFTPVSVAEKAAERIPDCELKILKGGTHYSPLEFPDVINETVDDFIERKIAWPAAPAPAAVRKTPKAAKKAAPKKSKRR